MLLWSPLFFISLVQLTKGGPEKADRCLSGWYHYNNTCYQLNSNPETFDLAEQNCKNQLAELADLSEAETKLFLLGRVGKAYSIWSSKHSTFPSYCNFVNKQGRAFEKCSAKHDFICHQETLTDGCQKGAFRWKDTCYYTLNTPEDLSASQQRCWGVQRSGNLAVIHDSETYMFLRKKLSNAISKLWIGLRKKPVGTGNQYRWLNKDKVRYTPWGSSHTGNEKDLCVSINLGAKNKLFVPTKCDDKLPALCQNFRFGVAPDSYKKNHVDLENCSRSWAEYEEYCYSDFNHSVSLEDAEAQCRQHGAHLLSLHNEEESKFISQTFSHHGARSLWISLKKDGPNKSLTWADGTPFDFANWADGEPSDTDTCTEVRLSDMKWSSVNCSSRDTNNYDDTRIYVCKKSRVSTGNAVISTPSFSTKSSSSYETDYVLLLTSQVTSNNREVGSTHTASVPSKESLENHDYPVITFTKYSTDTTFSKGGKIKFDCSAHGNPTPTLLTLTRSTQRTSEALVAVRATNLSFQIDFLTCVDTGVYTCSGENSQGTAAQEISVGVRCPQQLNLPLASGTNKVVYAVIGETVEVNLRVYGFPGPTKLILVRLFDNKNLTLSARHSVTYTATRAFFGLVSVLISGLMHEDFTLYSLTIENGVEDALVYTFLLKEAEKDENALNMTTVVIIGFVVVIIAVLVIFAIFLVSLKMFLKQRMTSQHKTQTEPATQDYHDGDYINPMELTSITYSSASTPTVSRERELQLQAHQYEDLYSTVSNLEANDIEHPQARKLRTFTESKKQMTSSVRSSPDSSEQNPRPHRVEQSTGLQILRSAKVNENADMAASTM
ncbi:hypothetical protein RRG08_035468 [Elysia crispata]|uniref:Uncharacterized protein n=1 Tax=Elysia crispata TaxID=231223 RepID=A0AAE1AQ62_9GAST|nr:hypothetical protein RRG08_035468 [Elysia crispata]